MKAVAQRMFKSHLDPTEEILEVCHRHPLVMSKDMVRVLFFGFFVPLFLYYLFPEGGVFFLLWGAISIVKLMYVLLNWYHDALLITNISLLKVAWYGFFNRTSARLEYPNIEGLTYSIQGFRKTVLNYGDVSISHSSGSVAIHLPDAINPPRVERLVLSYQEKFVSDQSLKDSQSLKNLLITMLRHHAKTQPTPKPAVAPTGQKQKQK